MNRRHVILDVWTSNDEKETEVYLVPEDTWRVLTAYRTGVDPTDSKFVEQFGQIADTLGFTSPPHLAQREQITAHWLREHGIRAGLFRWSCTLY